MVPRATSAPQGVGERLLALQVDPGGRLVEHEQVGLAGERAGDQHPLLLAAGQRGDAVPGLVGEADRLERGLDGLPVGPAASGTNGRRRESRPEATTSRTEAGTPEAAVDPLRDEADAVPARANAVERGAEQPDLAAAGRDQAHHRADQRGLAGAVGAEDGDHLARRHGEVDAAQDRPAAELDGAVGDRDCRSR